MGPHIYIEQKSMAKTLPCSLRFSFRTLSMTPSSTSDVRQTCPNLLFSTFSKSAGTTATYHEKLKYLMIEKFVQSHCTQCYAHCTQCYAHIVHNVMHILYTMLCTHCTQCYTNYTQCYAHCEQLYAQCI